MKIVLDGLMMMMSVRTKATQKCHVNLPIPRSMMTIGLKVYICIELLSKNGLLCVLFFEEILDILDAVDILDILVRLSLLQHVLYERFSSFITTPHKWSRCNV
jgi:hypothetical protein